MASRKDAQRRQGRAPSQRQLRVGEELRHVLAEVLQRGDFRDPALQSMNVTVTEVRVSPDLRNATAFVTPLGGGGDPAETVAALRRAAPFFRSQVAKAMRLRHAPTIGFEPDTSFDYASHIGTLLQDPDVRRDLGGIGDPEALEPGAEELDAEEPGAEEPGNEEGRDGGARGA